MWLPRRLVGAGAALAASLTLAGCTAQPLYSTSVAPSVSEAGGRTRDALRAVRVAPVNSREAQEVRNELIFLLSGGQGNAKNPAYELALSAYASSVSSTIAPIVGREQVPTSQLLTFTGNYTLTEAGTGRVLGRGTRQALANYDVPVQPFAEQRALRDAQDRAGRELAALLAAAVAADLATGREAAAAGG